MIRVLIAEDQHLVRQGLRALFERTGEIQVVGEAGRGEDAIALAARLKPDVVVMDLRMPDLNGDQVMLEMRARGITAPVIILSMFGDQVIVRQALQNGARGYLLKSSTMEQVLEAVRQVARGKIYVSPALAQAIESADTEKQANTDAINPFERLSGRERQVLKMMIQGNSTRTIANTLKLSVKTVEKHRTNLAAKLNVRDTATLIRLAIKHGWAAGEGNQNGGRVNP